jgi:hypothetical protein
LLVVVGSPLHGQEPESGAATAERAQQSAGPVEEVIVSGQRTRQSLINEAGRETEDFYARLNEVLDNDDFEITCRNERPPGSNIVTRVCRTRYQEELDSRAALSVMQGARMTDDVLEFNGIPFEREPELLRMQREFEEEMLQAVNTDPELNASVWRMLQLKAAVEGYETPRQERRRLEREAGAD